MSLLRLADRGSKESRNISQIKEFAKLGRWMRYDFSVALHQKSGQSEPWVRNGGENQKTTSVKGDTNVRFYGLNSSIRLEIDRLSHHGTKPICFTRCIRLGCPNYDISKKKWFCMSDQRKLRLPQLRNELLRVKNTCSTKENNSDAFLL
jgi:hypothetical protein